MDFNTYQRKASNTADYPTMEVIESKEKASYMYPLLGLIGEAGELTEKIKKIIRNNNGKMSKEEKESLKYEIGDCLWYIAMLCIELGFSLEDIAKKNIKKLESRKERGVIKSSGDYR